MKALPVERSKIRQPYRWFALLLALALLYSCARYYPVWMVNNFYHPAEPNGGLLAFCAAFFLVGAYLVFVAALGRWAPRPEASCARKLASAVAAIIVSLIAVVSILAWDFRGP